MLANVSIPKKSLQLESCQQIMIQQSGQQTTNKEIMKKEAPKAFLLMHNVSKKNNIGNIIRSACAFNFQKVFYISNRPEGSKKMKAMKQFHTFGNQGTYKQIDYHPFSNLQFAKEYFKQNNIRVCGVEIGPTSIPIQKHPFTGDTVFFMGNQGTGILDVHKKICDFFVYIPQYTNKTASLNVSVAAGIIFHHFALWAGYEQASTFDEKYQFQEQPIGQPKREKKEIQDEKMQENKEYQIHEMKVEVQNMEIKKEKEQERESKQND